MPYVQSLPANAALHDAVSVCALFNFMNRLVEGLGIEAGESYFERAAERLAAETGYAGLVPAAHASRSLEGDRTTASGARAGEDSTGGRVQAGEPLG